MGRKGGSRYSFGGWVCVEGFLDSRGLPINSFVKLYIISRGVARAFFLSGPSLIPYLQPINYKNSPCMLAF